MVSVSQPTEITANSADFLQGLPKCELHVHLEGTLEPELKLQLAQRNGVDIGQTSVDEIKATYKFHSLASFLAVYYPAMQVLVKEQDFYDLASAYFQRAATNSIRHVEAFFDPQAHTTRGVPIADVIGGYSRAAKDAAAYGVDADLILCFLRDMSAESALETFRAALPLKHLFIGIGLDSDERGNPPSKFAEVFALARTEGLKRTMHCDIEQVGSMENIRQALHDIGVDRIDHGTNILEDPALVEFARQRGIGLTCCPMSNSFVASEMKAKEMIELMRAGVRVTINSDDPAYFGGYLVDNYSAMVEKGGISIADAVALAKNSYEVSWLPEERKKSYLDEIDVYVAANSA